MGPDQQEYHLLGSILFPPQIKVFFTDYSSGFQILVFH